MNRKLVLSMEVVVHYPKSVTAQKALKQKVAEIHAKSIVNRINEMQLSEKDTKKLINMICERVNQ